jgi:hypothetical protein
MICRPILLNVLELLPVTFFSFNQCIEVLALVPISSIQNAMKWMWPPKSVGLDGTPSFVIESCSKIFGPVIKFIFNFYLSLVTFPNLWKQAAIIPVFEKGNNSTVTLKLFLIFLKFLNLLYMTMFLKSYRSKLNFSQYSFIKCI